MSCVSIMSLTLGCLGSSPSISKHPKALLGRRFLAWDVSAVNPLIHTWVTLDGVDEESVITEMAGAECWLCGC